MSGGKGVPESRHFAMVGRRRQKSVRIGIPDGDVFRSNIRGALITLRRGDLFDVLRPRLRHRKGRRGESGRSCADESAPVHQVVPGGRILRGGRRILLITMVGC